MMPKEISKQLPLAVEKLIYKYSNNDWRWVRWEDLWFKFPAQMMLCNVLEIVYYKIKRPIIYKSAHYRLHELCKHKMTITITNDLHHVKVITYELD